MTRLRSDGHMNKSLIAAALAAFAFAASAKLPPPDPAAKAKADEAAAKTAWQAKVDSYLTCKMQDKLAAKYGKNGGVKPSADKAKTAASAIATAASAPTSTASAPAGAASA